LCELIGVPKSDEPEGDPGGLWIFRLNAHEECADA
jgi:hypothetical protein